MGDKPYSDCYALKKQKKRTSILKFCPDIGIKSNFIVKNEEYVRLDLTEMYLMGLYWETTGLYWVVYNQEVNYYPTMGTYPSTEWLNQALADQIVMAAIIDEGIKERQDERKARGAGPKSHRTRKKIKDRFHAERREKRRQTKVKEWAWGKRSYFSKAHALRSIDWEEMTRDPLFIIRYKVNLRRKDRDDFIEAESCSTFARITLMAAFGITLIAVPELKLGALLLFYILLIIWLYIIGIAGLLRRSHAPKEWEKREMPRVETRFSIHPSCQPEGFVEEGIFRALLNAYILRQYARKVKFKEHLVCLSVFWH